MEKVFYRCNVCGNIAGLVFSGGGKMVCCGQPMEKLEANSKDAAQEKHVPAVELDGAMLKVQVGDVLHPMTPEHYIQWIMCTQGNKTQRVELSPDDEPKAEFIVEPGKGKIVVYEYCNLHSLWKKELN